MATPIIANRIRLGILTLPISIALLIIGFEAQSAVDPSADISSSQAEQITSNSYTLGSFLFGIASLLMVFGLFSLYAYLANSRVERLALIAMVLSVVGVASGVGFVGIDTVMQVAGELYLRGERSVLEAYWQTMTPGDIFLTILNRGLRLVGFVLFGIAIWRSGTLPKGAAVLWISSELVFPIERVIGIGTAYLVGGALLIVAAGWIAWTIWRQPDAEVAGAGARPRVQ